jgi:hypothetical protein
MEDDGPQVLSEDETDEMNGNSRTLRKQAIVMGDTHLALVDADTTSVGRTHGRLTGSPPPDAASSGTVRERPASARRDSTVVVSLLCCVTCGSDI